MQITIELTGCEAVDIGAFRAARARAIEAAELERVKAGLAEVWFGVESGGCAPPIYISPDAINPDLDPLGR